MNNIDSNNAEELLKQKGVRPTANRILILKTLQNEHRPMSLSTMEAILLPMDKSSIFRVLTLFLEHDIVHAFEDGKGALNYELCSHHDSHDHTAVTPIPVTTPFTGLEVIDERNFLRPEPAAF